MLLKKAHKIDQIEHCAVPINKTIVKSFSCRVPINTPDEVADTAIDAVLRNRCEVITSSLIMRIMLKFYA